MMRTVNVIAVGTNGWYPSQVGEHVMFDVIKLIRNYSPEVVVKQAYDRILGATELIDRVEKRKTNNELYRESFYSYMNHKEPSEKDIMLAKERLRVYQQLLMYDGVNQKEVMLKIMEICHGLDVLDVGG